MKAARTSAAVFTVVVTTTTFAAIAHALSSTTDDQNGVHRPTPPASALTGRWSPFAHKAIFEGAPRLSSKLAEEWWHARSWKAQLDLRRGPLFDGSRRFEAERLQAPKAGLKSPPKALLFSAVLPGAGQVYAKSYIKGIAFLAVEIASWTGYAQYHRRGEDLKRQFQSFANAHWSEDEYWNWIAQESGYPRSQLDSLRAWERDHFSHFLPPQKDQQYYENIGKYDQFNVGWDDTSTPRGRDSKNRNQYLDLRADSNRNFNRASTGAAIALANHVLSALDAVWSTHRYNKRLRMSLRIEPLYYGGVLHPSARLTARW